jgi:hypothetical protein
MLSPAQPVNKTITRTIAANKIPVFFAITILLVCRILYHYTNCARGIQWTGSGNILWGWLQIYSIFHMKPQKRPDAEWFLRPVGITFGW